MFRPLALLTIFAAIATIPGCARNRSLNQLPPAVKATVQEHVRDGRIDEIDEKHHDGMRLYEVEYKLNSKHYELKVDEQGRVVEKED